MRAGLMRRRITLQTVERTPDGGGGYTETLTDLATVWARVHPLTGREQLLAMQTEAMQMHRFTIRYRAGLTTATRILYDGRTFDIRSIVDPEERHRELQIMAEEVN